MFELRTVVGVSSIESSSDMSKWDGTIYSRHGGTFKKWWMDERRQNVPIQIDALPRQLPYGQIFTLIYVRIHQVDTERLRNEFLTNIGGQVHV